MLHKFIIYMYGICWYYKPKLQNRNSDCTNFKARFTREYKYKRTGNTGNEIHEDLYSFKRKEKNILKSEFRTDITVQSKCIEKTQRQTTEIIYFMSDYKPETIIWNKSNHAWKRHLQTKKSQAPFLQLFIFVTITSNLHHMFLLFLWIIKVTLSCNTHEPNCFDIFWGRIKLLY